jgi:hypothetical protein
LRSSARLPLDAAAIPPFHQVIEGVGRTEMTPVTNGELIHDFRTVRPLDTELSQSAPWSGEAFGDYRDLAKKNSP